MNTAELLQTALQHHRAGRLEDAEPIYWQILQAEPNHADAWHLVGVLAYTRGQHIPALQYIRQALQLDARQAAYHFNLGEVHRALGQAAQAQACYEQALRLKPDHARAHNNLGTLLQDQGRLAEAEACYRQALHLDPGYAIAANNLGAVLLARGELAQARSVLENLLQREPGYVEAHNNLGAVLQREGKPDQALACFQQALRLKPDHAPAHHNLGTLHQAEGRLAEARACFEQALRLKPDFAEARGRLVHALLAEGCLDPAREILRKMAPDAAARLCLEYLEGLMFTARTSEYDAVLAMAQSLFPHDVGLEAAGLFRLHFEDLVDHAELSRRYRRWSARHFPNAPASIPDRPPRAKTSRLRLAYVGTYLHHMYMDPVFRCHGRSQFDILVFTDDVRMDLAGLYPGLQVQRLTGIDLVRACREQGVDIAVDLCGSIPFRNGLRQITAFHQRLAPIQCNWVATIDTSGSPAFDYLIGDAQVVAPEDESLYTERLARLPEVWLCWRPPDNAPAPGPLPARSNGYITFGTANRGFKIHDAQLRLWAEVLARCPGSRFHIKGQHATDPAFRDRAVQLFAEKGVASDRLLFRPHSDHPDFLNFYRDIDISLDTYPYTGCITTQEALWMGVPVVTRFGRTFVARTSRSILAVCGRSAWFAGSDEDYLRIACDLAADLEALEEERHRLRGDLEKSPMCNAPVFTRHLEELYVRMLEAGGQVNVAVPPKAPR
ncbi:MAG: tetratricopeptide repeat protein [Planctomycetes bacterium]|nr:tetratricopeptide repeat protein [Planctomycetota bacterium]